MAYTQLSSQNNGPLTCGICGAAMPTLLFCANAPDRTSSEQFKVFKCGTCGSAQISALPDGANYQTLYSKEYWGGKKTQYQWNIKNALTDVFLRQRVNTIAACITKDSVVLDYGCGNGEFVDAMRKAGYHCYGFEPNTNSDSEYINSAINRRAYDFITLWHVFEHFNHPDEEFSRIVSLLSDKGKLFLSIPNFESIDSRIGGAAWFHLDVPRHMFHYSQRGISIIIARNGMKILRSKIPFNWYAVFGMYQTLFNISGCSANAFYYWLKRGRNIHKDKSMTIALKDILLHVCLAVPYLIIAFMATFIASLVNKSGSLEILSEKQ